MASKTKEELCECGHPKEGHWFELGGCVYLSPKNSCPCPAFEPVEDIVTKAWKRVGKHLKAAMPPLAQEAKPEHIFTPVPGATSMRCSCGKVLATTSEQQQHVAWHLAKPPQLDEEELERVILDQIMATVSLSRVKGKPKGMNWVRCCSGHGDLYEFRIDRKALKAALLAWARKGR